MRILYLVPYVPNLIRVRPFNFIKNLVSLGHDVTVLTLVTSDADRADVEMLRSICEVSAENLPRTQSLINCLKAVPTKKSLQTVYCWHKPLADKAVSYLQSGKFDVLHVEHLRGALFALHCKRLVPNMPVIWDSVDCISYLFEQAAAQSQNKMSQLMTRLDLARTKRFEATAATHFEHTVVTSRLDKQAFRTLASDHAPNISIWPNSNISVVANGVDLDYFSVGQVERHPSQLVVSGKMSYHANQAMVRFLMDEVMPLVWQHKPQTELVIVGKDPSAEIIKMAEHPCVTVTGSVEDIRPYLHRATIAVAPILYGAGIQNKVLEAMACGTPTVVTPKAVAALDQVDEEVFLVGRDSAELSQHILELLNNPARRKAIQQAARDFVEKKHHWLIATKNVVQIYQQAVGRAITY